MSALIPTEQIEKKILLIRGRKVMLDGDLAPLYGVSVKRLNEQVRRNPKRFPPDFMFQLAASESESLRSHFATLKRARGQHRKYLPLCFHRARSCDAVFGRPERLHLPNTYGNVGVTISRVGDTRS